MGPGVVRTGALREQCDRHGAHVFGGERDGHRQPFPHHEGGGMAMLHSLYQGHGIGRRNGNNAGRLSE